MLNQTKFNNYDSPSFFHEHNQNQIRRKIKYGMYGKKKKNKIKQNKTKYFFPHTHPHTS